MIVVYRGVKSTEYLQHPGDVLIVAYYMAQVKINLRNFVLFRHGSGRRGIELGTCEIAGGNKLNLVCQSSRSMIDMFCQVYNGHAHPEN